MTEFTPAQQALLDKHRDINVDHDWWDSEVGYIGDLLGDIGVFIMPARGHRRNGSSFEIKYGSVEFDIYRGEFSFESLSFDVCDVVRMYRECVGEAAPEQPHETFLDATSTCRLQTTIRAHLHDITTKLDLLTLMAPPEELLDNLRGEFTRRRGVQFDNDTLYDYDEEYPAAVATIREIQEDFAEMGKAICHDATTLLRQEYEYLTSDEAVWETLEANGITPRTTKTTKRSAASRYVVPSPEAPITQEFFPMAIIIQAPVESVRAVVGRFVPITSTTALSALRQRLALALQPSMTNTQLYALTDVGNLASLEPEVLAANVPPLVLAAAYHTVRELQEALGDVAAQPEPASMVYAEGWQPLGDVAYPAAGALAVEFLPRELSPAPHPTAPEARQPSVPSAGEPSQYVPLPAVDLTVPSPKGPGRPAKSGFGNRFERRQRVAKAPGWVYDLFDTADRLMTQPAGEMLAGERTLGPVEAYATTVDLLNRMVRRLDPNLTVGQLQAWLAETLSAIDGTEAGDAALHFVRTCSIRPEKSDKGGE